MIRTLTAHTAEIDDVDAAVKEILEQLQLEKTLLKNTFGIITCYVEFTDSGVVEALCAKLPFDVIGGTTLGNGVPGELGRMMLGVTVLTSDDVFFSAVLSDPLKSVTMDVSMDGAFKKAAGKLPEKPVMVLTFAPFINNIGGDEMVAALDKASGQIPLFGTLPSAHPTDYSKGKTIFNGKAYEDRMGMVLLSGNVKPVFSVESLSEDKVLAQKAIITDSDGNIIKGVNGISVLNYLKSIGLASGDKFEGLISIPFVVDFNDGTKPVVRAVFTLTPEGYAICGGAMPVNATLGIGSIDKEEVLHTARESVENAVAHGGSGVFMFTCGARNLALGFDVLSELEEIEKTMSGQLPYMASYSGGEICPVLTEDGKFVNRFHNYSIISWLL